MHINGNGGANDLAYHVNHGRVLLTRMLAMPLPFLRFQITDTVQTAELPTAAAVVSSQRQ